jgi:hypothetical protein
MTPPAEDCALTVTATARMPDASATDMNPAPLPSGRLSCMGSPLRNPLRAIMPTISRFASGRADRVTKDGPTALDGQGRQFGSSGISTAPGVTSVAATSTSVVGPGAATRSVATTSGDVRCETTIHAARPPKARATKMIAIRSKASSCSCEGRARPRAR